MRSKRDRAKAHARLSHHCSCGAVVYGNGGKAGHFGGQFDPERQDAREAAGHRQITASEHARRFPKTDPEDPPLAGPNPWPT